MSEGVVYLGLSLSEVMGMTPIQLNMLKYAWSKRQRAMAAAQERSRNE